MNTLTKPITLIAILGFAAAAGFFYAYSISVMVGLDAAPPAAAIQAMQGINREVTNFWFSLSFFGAPIYAAIAIIICFMAGERKAVVWMLMAGIVYMTGTFAITVSQHLPRNDALASINVADTALDMNDIWQGYSSEWTWWNHARTLSSLAATALAALSFRAIGKA